MSIEEIVHTITMAVTGVVDGLGDGVWLQHSLCLSLFQFLVTEALERELCLSLLNDSSEAMLWHVAICVITILCLMADCIYFWVGSNPWS